MEQEKSLSQIETSENQIFLRFDKINYVLKKGDKRHILKDCTGQAFPGRFLAILGTSGAGKSSLLNILAGRLRTSSKYSVDGKIMLNGQTHFKQTAFQQNTAYVVQQDLVYETLKVGETLDLSASLRLSKTMPKEEKEHKINRLISALSLEKCRNTLVGGGHFRGVSGGERKRVCIGNELITNPTLFFADEPTSGLDSYNALKILKLLINLARSGRTVVATLHQPSSEMFSKFDDLLVISAGYIIYNGPADLSVQVFERMGYPLPLNCNPADHFIAVANVRKGEDEQRIKSMSSEYREILKDIEENKQLVESAEQITDKIGEREIVKPNAFEQTWTLIKKRSLKHYLRTPSTTYIRLIQTVFFALIAGVLFFDIGYTPRELAARDAALFFVITNLTFNSLLNVILVFPTEKPIVVNELNNGMYSALAYFLSKILIEIPFNVVIVILYQLILYWMIGFGNTPQQFFLFFLILATNSTIAYILGVLVGTLAPNGDLAITFSSVITLPSMLFSGFFINADDMQSWISWATYANFFRYMLDLLVYNEYNSDSFIVTPCDNFSYCTGKQYLAFRGLDDLNFWGWYAIGIGFLIFYTGLSFISFYFLTRKNIGKPLSSSDK